MKYTVDDPRFDLTRFLSGRTKAWGLVEDRFGRVRRSFSVDLEGGWNNYVFLLDETFRFDDGEVEQRTWRIVPGETGHFTATCADCVGVAHGATSANEIRMSYRFRLKMNGRSFVVDFDDRIHRMENGIALNRATIRKWGVRLGELYVVFSQQPAAADGRATAA